MDCFCLKEVNLFLPCVVICSKRSVIRKATCGLFVVKLMTPVRRTVTGKRIWINPQGHILVTESKPQRIIHLKETPLHFQGHRLDKGILFLAPAMCARHVPAPLNTELLQCSTVCLLWLTLCPDLGAVALRKINRCRILFCFSTGFSISIMSNMSYLVESLLCVQA